MAGRLEFELFDYKNEFRPIDRYNIAKAILKNSGKYEWVTENEDDNYSVAVFRDLSTSAAISVEGEEDLDKEEPAFILLSGDKSKIQETERRLRRTLLPHVLNIKRVEEKKRKKPLEEKAKS